jgi:hypothetical protein
MTLRQSRCRAYNAPMVHLCRYALLLLVLASGGCSLMSEPYEEPEFRERMQEFERQHPSDGTKRVHGGVI